MKTTSRISIKVIRSSLVPRRLYSSKSNYTEILGQKYFNDEWTNIPKHLIEKTTTRKLHLQENHPIGIIRKRIESHFKNYVPINNLSSVVSTYQNFDSLGFPTDHVGRSVSDSYYINHETMLRTHTSAHQLETYKQGLDAFLLSGDVYRRDEIDKSHYPVFHQMEGARLFHRGENLEKSIKNDMITSFLQTDQIRMVDNSPISEENPNQLTHTRNESEIISAHLKHSLNSLVQDLFGHKGKELQIRWVKAYFPFTLPSWELEILYDGKTWLEVLGCGVIKQDILNNAGVSKKIGWAFGLGLERLAMVLFGIPDIRLFWSKDSRFLSQFKESQISTFKPYSRYPPCYKDLAFWINNDIVFEPNDFNEVVRNIAGDLVEDVKCIDEFTHPKTKRKSMCYRINYRSMDRNLTNEEVNEVHQKVIESLKVQLDVEIR